MRSQRNDSEGRWPAVGIDLDELLADATMRPSVDGAAGEPAGTLVGEVIDTHHPHRPGRILVRWESAAHEVCEAWLVPIASLRGRIGDRVLLVRPGNWSEWIATAVLGGPPAPPQPSPPAAAHEVRLEVGQAIQIHAADGTPLFAIEPSARGPVVRVLGRDLELAVDGRLRLAADRIECVSGQGGTDLRSDGEIVARSPRIRLN